MKVKFRFRYEPSEARDYRYRAWYKLPQHWFWRKLVRVGYSALHNYPSIEAAIDEFNKPRIVEWIYKEVELGDPANERSKAIKP